MRSPVDSRGNIYVGENFDARRFQRFLFKGLGTPKPGANPADNACALTSVARLDVPRLDQPLAVHTDQLVDAASGSRHTHRHVLTD